MATIPETDHTWHQAIEEGSLNTGTFAWHPQQSVMISIAEDFNGYRRVAFAYGQEDERNIVAHSDEEIDQLLVEAQIPETGWLSEQEWNDMFHA